MKTNVIEVKETPSLKKPALCQGVRDKKAAQAWGEKNGYATVYFLAKRERVYAEKMLARVDVQAEDIEQTSAELLTMAEGAR